MSSGLARAQKSQCDAKKTGVVTTSQTSRAKTEVKANTTKKPKVADVKKEEKVKPSKGQQQKKKTETKAKAREDTKRKRVVETKAPAADDSDSEDDMPLAARR